jgi:predicted component of type VI protein secretion system
MTSDRSFMERLAKPRLRGQRTLVENPKELTRSVLRNLQHILNVVARIDDYGFAAGLVSHDGAIALQRADRENFVDHRNIVTRKLPRLTIEH